MSENTIKEVKVGKYGSAVTLLLESGKEVQLNLQGDCCSGSYFEDNSCDEMEGLVGEELRSIERASARIEDKEVEYTVSKYHALKITTDKSSLTVDWRNDSNGYYDGWCEVYGWETTDFKPW